MCYSARVFGGGDAIGDQDFHLRSTIIFVYTIASSQLCSLDDGGIMAGVHLRVLVLYVMHFSDFVAARSRARISNRLIYVPHLCLVFLTFCFSESQLLLLYPFGTCSRCCICSCMYS